MEYSVGLGIIPVMGLVNTQKLLFCVGVIKIVQQAQLSMWPLRGVRMGRLLLLGLVWSASIGLGLFDWVMFGTGMRMETGRTSTNAIPNLSMLEYPEFI